jgi:hypothetical protein
MNELRAAEMRPSSPDKIQCFHRSLLINASYINWYIALRPSRDPLALQGGDIPALGIEQEAYELGMSGLYRIQRTCNIVMAVLSTSGSASVTT